MKKKIFGGIAVLVIVVAAAWNVSLSSKMKGMSDLSLANVEALAADENGTYYSNRSDYYDPNKKCYQQCVKDGDSCFYVNNYPYNC